MRERLTVSGEGLPWWERREFERRGVKVRPSPIAEIPRVDREPLSMRETLAMLNIYRSQFHDGHGRPDVPLPALAVIAGVWPSYFNSCRRAGYLSEAIVGRLSPVLLALQAGLVHFEYPSDDWTEAVLCEGPVPLRVPEDKSLRGRRRCLKAWSKPCVLDVSLPAQVVQQRVHRRDPKSALPEVQIDPCAVDSCISRRLRSSAEHRSQFARPGERLRDDESALGEGGRGGRAGSADLGQDDPEELRAGLGHWRQHGRQRSAISDVFAVWDDLESDCYDWSSSPAWEV